MTFHLFRRELETTWGVIDRRSCLSTSIYLHKWCPTCFHNTLHFLKQRNHRLFKFGSGQFFVRVHCFCLVYQWFHLVKVHQWAKSNCHQKPNFHIDYRHSLERSYYLPNTFQYLARRSMLQYIFYLFLNFLFLVKRYQLNCGYQFEHHQDFLHFPCHHHKRLFYLHHQILFGCLIMMIVGQEQVHLAKIEKVQSF